MSTRTAWTMAFAALVVGIGAGAAATYLLVPPRDAEATGLPAPESRRPDHPSSDAGPPPPRLEPTELRPGDLINACGFSEAKSIEIRGYSVVYYYVSESNSYKDGHSDVASGYGAVATGQRLTLVAARQPSPGTRLLPAFLGDGSGSMALNLPEEEFAGGRVVISYWGVEKPLELRVGQSATLFQFGSVDGRTGASSANELQFSRDPLAEFKPLRRIKDGENYVARLTVRAMRMDPSWTLESPEVKQFLDFRKAMRRAAGAGE